MGFAGLSGKGVRFTQALPCGPILDREGPTGKAGHLDGERAAVQGG